MSYNIKYDELSHRLKLEGIELNNLVTQLKAPLSVILQITRNCHFNCEFCSEKDSMLDPTLDELKKYAEHLKNVPELTQMLGRDKNEFTPIEAGKEAMFKAMVNDNYEIPLSVGIIEGDKVIVKEGPLSGMEGLIKKIDRHKRVAVLNAQMFEQDVDIRIGLEIIEKYKK